MGEIADMILEGELCQICGVFLENSKGEFPQSCNTCEPKRKRKKKKKGAVSNG